MTSTRMELEATPDHGIALLDFISAYNDCSSPKDALRLVQGLDKVATACISVETDAVDVYCTNMAGSLLAECRFALDACITELASKLRAAISDDDIAMTCFTFLSDAGDEVGEGEYLKDHGKLAVQMRLSATDVGELMYVAGDTVSVQMLGQCLGNHGDFWKEVAIAYPKHFTCFRNMGIVQAIRAYLWCFRLPGEAAQIERILDGFARSYFHHNARENSKDAAEQVYNTELIDSSSDCDNTNPSRKTCWNAPGWYVHQPLSGPQSQKCCISCGNLDGDAGELVACQGCNVVQFCRQCRRDASKYGHAIVGMIGYGRACVAARHAIGMLGPDQRITYMMHGGTRTTSVVSNNYLDWEQISPFKTQDSIFILSYAIIMLTTNLHSVNVKSKMKKHEFIKQNKGVNGGDNFPGDFLSKVYDDVQREELKVMRD